MENWVYVICELLAPAALSAGGSAACTDCVGGGGLGDPRAGLDAFEMRKISFHFIVICKIMQI